MKNLHYLTLALFFVSCTGGNTFKTEKGTEVTYLKKGSENVSDTLITYMTLKYETEANGVLFETTPDQPSPVRIDSLFKTRPGEFIQVIKALKIGDSVLFTLSANELFLENFNRPVPDTIDATSQVAIYISLMEQVTMDEYQNKALTIKRDMMLSQVDQEQQDKDIEEIDNFLKENGIEAIKYESGIRIEVKEEGKGPKPALGQGVKVNYSGRLLTGEYFDSSVEEVAKAQGLYTEGRQYGPYSIKVYNSPVITGWHEGILQLNEGTKATLYIPSPLAYGNRKRSDVIVENSILVFDIEVVEVED